jgi:hypothetical protein
MKVSLPFTGSTGLREVSGIGRILLTLLLAAACHADEPSLAPPEQQVAGLSQEDWSRNWWQWAGAFEIHSSPIADLTGELCASKQAGPVWFLAGTYDTKRTTRTCNVPRGKYLFFPLINYIVMPTGQGSISCETAIRNAALMTDKVENLALDVDGIAYRGLTRHRQATRQCFNMGARAEPRYDIYPSAANGYYVMLKPLSPGRHTLSFRGTLPDMTQAVAYTLIVK